MSSQSSLTLTLAVYLLLAPNPSAAKGWWPAIKGRALNQVGAGPTSSTPAASAPASACATEQDVEFVGGDLDVALADSESAQQCCDLCSSTPECSAWTFKPEDSMCFLKSLAFTRTPAPAVISGLKPGAFNTAMSPAGPATYPDTVFLASATAIDTESGNTTCLMFSTDEVTWVINGSAMAYGASTDYVPPPSIVEALMSEICEDPQAAGMKLHEGVAQGGEQALYWTYAMLAAECEVEDAPGVAYQVAIDTVNSGDPADLQTASDWFANLAAAADAVGFPLCASLVVVDAATGTVLEQREFHTRREVGDRITDKR